MPTITLAPDEQDLVRELRRRLQAFERSPSLEEATRIMGAAERLRQERRIIESKAKGHTHRLSTDEIEDLF